MPTVQSNDGTRIGYSQLGQGPAVILVAGALGCRANGVPQELAEQLAKRFTVIDYDRRGRGESGDTLPYAVEREIEDLDTLIDAVGGTAALYGISSGGVLALETASRLPHKVTKLALYEPPLIVDSNHAPVRADYVPSLQAAVAEGRRGDAVEIFMIDAVGIPREYVDHMRNAPPAPPVEGEMRPPAWSDMEAIAHTLAYDGIIMGPNMSGNPLRGDHWKTAAMPTLVIAGGASETFMHTGADALAALLPNAQRQTLEGQDHAVSPVALAPVLEAFFAG